VPAPDPAPPVIDFPAPLHPAPAAPAQPAAKPPLPPAAAAHRVEVAQQPTAVHQVVEEPQPQEEAVAAAAGGLPPAEEPALEPVRTTRVPAGDPADGLTRTRGRGLPPGGRGPGGGRRFSIPPPPRSPVGRVLAASAIVLVVFGFWFLLALFQPFKGDGSGEVQVKVTRGLSVGKIADLLADRGIVSSSFMFEVRATIGGHRGDLKPGTYTLRRNMSYGAAIKALTAGPPPPKLTTITITEGRSRTEIDRLLRSTSLQGGYAAATKSSPLLNTRAYGAPRNVASLEGFLFPATYEVRVGAPVSKLVDQQLETFKDRIAQVNMRRARSKNLTVFDVLIIASMVEKEAQLDRERPLIAAVIYNRLKQHIPLGIDATIRFATGNWERPLRQSELAIDSPYNTRRRAGLPPGPIGNPGLASIEAAAHPAAVKYLYYVVKPGTCGAHAFSSTDAQFQRDVARYNAARARSGGRSPTTCR
jgi:uncharacterized YceG family protein